MKQFLIYLFLFLTVSVTAQTTYPIPQGLGGPQTMVNVGGGLNVKGALVIPNFVDTAAANLIAFLRFTPNAQITTGDSLWKRNQLGTAWKLMNGGGNVNLSDSSSKKLTGDIINISGYTYRSTVHTYQILGRYYISQPDTFVITGSHSTLDRFTIVYANVNGTIALKDGNIGNPAAIPTVDDPLTQVVIATYSIPATSSAPVVLPSVDEFRPQLVRYNGIGAGVNMRVINKGYSVHMWSQVDNVGGLRFYAPLANTYDLQIGYLFSILDLRHNKTGHIFVQAYDQGAVNFSATKDFDQAIRIRVGIDATNGNRMFIELGDSTTNWSDAIVNLEYEMVRQTDQARLGWYSTPQGVMINPVYSGTRIVDTVLAAKVISVNGMTGDVVIADSRIRFGIEDKDSVDRLMQFNNNRIALQGLNSFFLQTYPNNNLLSFDDRSFFVENQLGSKAWRVQGDTGEIKLHHSDASLYINNGFYNSTDLSRLRAYNYSNQKETSVNVSFDSTVIIALNEGTEDTTRLKVKTNGVTIDRHSTGAREVITSVQVDGIEVLADVTGKVDLGTIPGAGWGLTGNAGTNSETDFIGTTDNRPFSIKILNRPAADFSISGDGVSVGFNGSTASGIKSFATGIATTASGVGAASMGFLTKSSGAMALASGQYTSASGYNSATFGFGTKSKYQYGFVIGHNNDTTSSSVGITVGNQGGAYQPTARLFQIGNGDGTNQLGHNAVTVLENGNTGLNVLEPDSTLHIAGGFKLQNGTQGFGKVLTSDANGGAIWANQSVFDPTGLQAEIAQKLPLSGGTLTGDLNIMESITGTPNGSKHIMLKDGAGNYAFRGLNTTGGWKDGVPTQWAQFGNPLANVIISAGLGTTANRLKLKAYSTQVVRDGDTSYVPTGIFEVRDNVIVTPFFNVLNNGNIGVSNPNAIAKLDVSGSGRFTEQLTIPNGVSEYSAVNLKQLDSIKDLRDTLLLQYPLNATGGVVNIAQSFKDSIPYLYNTNLGLGISTPTQRIDIVKNVPNSEFVGERVYESGLGGSIYMGVAKNSNGAYTVAGLWANTPTPSVSNGILGVDNAGNVAHTGTNIYYVTGGANRMYINPAGTVGINTISADVSSLLDITSTSKGVLLPRMTKAERNTNIISPAQGLLVFVTDGTGYLSWYNAGWQKVNSIAD